MPVSYVGAIRNVLGQYPPSKGLFREILQNSEDAKATKQIFVLDNRTSSNAGAGKLIVQSPALLAYNDSVFTEKDFESLFTLWDSSKKADTTKIGKFGMGFRSTFHLTDTPQVLSDAWLAILDPLGENKEPDRKIDLNSTERHAENLTPFALDLFGSDTSTLSTVTSTPSVKCQKPSGGTDEAFHGTVVRLPLRTAPSDISGKVFTPKDIQRLLNNFIQEEIRIELLFLTHVASIEVYEISADYQVTCLARTTITRVLPALIELDGIPDDMREASYVDLAERSEVRGCALPEEKWRILRTAFDKQKVTTELSKHLGFDAEAALEKHKLQPFLAIAVKLSILDDQPDTSDAMAVGRLFTYLPLPLLTQFCVHVHGLFALTPSREKLQNREETPAAGTDYHISVEWNRLLFDAYLPQAWMVLLSMLAASNIRNIFAAWPPPQKPNQLGDSGYWENLPFNLLHHIKKEKAYVWPVFGLDEFCGLGDVLVAGGQEQEEILRALASVGVRFTKPTKVVVELLRKYQGVEYLTPESVYKSLLKLVDNLASETLTDKMVIISKYLLSTGKLEFIIGLPLITTKNRRITFSRPSTVKDYTLLEPSEFNLFGEFDKDAIDIGIIDPFVANLLKQRGPGTLNVRLLSPHIVLGYLQNYPGLVHGAGDEDAPVKWLARFWVWMKDWHSASQLYRSLGPLHLVPTHDGLKPTDRPIFETNGMHPLIISSLRTLRVPFVHNSFDTPARNALKIYKSFGDVRNLADVLDALDMEVVESFQIGEETAGQLVHYIATFADGKLSEERKEKLRTLPIYPSFPRTSGARVRISNGFKVLGVDLKSLKIVPALQRTTILDCQLSGVNAYLLQAVEPGTQGVLNDMDILRLALKHFMAQPNAVQQAFVQFMASNTRSVPGELADILEKIPFVPTAGGSRRAPSDLVDPHSPLAELFARRSEVLPRNDDDATKKLVENLRTLRLLQVSLSNSILEERINHIISTGNDQCARKLIRLIYDTRFPLPRTSAVIYESWIPTPKGLLSPRDCRYDPHHRELFDLVLSPLEHGLKADSAFQATFGWDQPVPFQVLAEQLSLVLNGMERDKYNIVYSIAKELVARESKLSVEEILDLKTKVAGHDWVPVSGKGYQLVKSEYAVFKDEDPIAGFYLIVVPGVYSLEFFMRMGCSKRPSVRAIIQRLFQLQQEIPSISVTQKALRLLKRLPVTLSSEERSRVFIPDTSNTLRPFSTVFFNDIGDRVLLVHAGLDNKSYVAHPDICEALAKFLHMKRLGLEFADLKPFGNDMGEKLSTTIANKLRSYTYRQVLTEFVANASDAGATEFGIMTTDASASGGNLLANTLTHASRAPSLVLYNNAVFTQSDFDGLCQTGVGGKSNRTDSIGQFGFGALTMFHLTDSAMIVSGDSVVFLDPSKQLLPISGRATLSLPLKLVKHFQTLFWLPLRNGTSKSSFGEIWNIERVWEDIIEPFKTNAHEFMLFTMLSNVTIYHRSRQEIAHRWNISSICGEETRTGEFTSKTLDITISTHRENHAPKNQSWRVASTSTFKHSEAPQLSAKYRLRSPVVLALAARVDAKYSSLRKADNLKYSFCSTLPLSLSSLPVHLSAPFILSDDRRQIRLDSLDPAAADYNRWLLANAIPPLYLFLLSDLLEIGQDNALWWPGNSTEEDEPSHIVMESFYKQLLDSHHRVFLHAHAHKDKITLLPKEVALWFSSTNLDHVLHLIKAPLASLPRRVTLKAFHGGVSKMTARYLHQLIKRSSINLAENLENEELADLLAFLSKDTPDNLFDLRLLPLASHNFGVIESAANASQTYFVAPESAHILFPANDHLIRPDFKFEILFDLQRQSINLVGFNGQGLRLLLADVLQERDVVQHDVQTQKWITNFWQLFSKLNADIAEIRSFPLVPTRTGLYTSLNQCKDPSAIILSNSTEPQWLWGALASLGLSVVDRHDPTFPPYLRHTLLSSPDFPSLSRFEDVLSAMKRIHLQSTRFADLAELQNSMADWCRSKLETSTVPGALLTIARSLPIWPVAQPPGYLPATDVTILPTGIPLNIAARFMNNSPTTYSFGLLRLREEQTSFKNFVQSLVLPHVLPERDVPAYKELLIILLSQARIIPPISFEVLVPDSNSVLCRPRELYARDPLFLRAFEGSSQFILEAYGDIEHRFIKFGLKREIDLDIDTFKDCANAVQYASSLGAIDVERAAAVFDAYNRTLPERISSGQQNQWSTLDGIRFIPRDPSRRLSSGPINMDTSLYVKALPDIVSPNELILPGFEPIAWTQRAHFRDQPGDTVKIANPALGVPTFPEVVEHLKTLTLRVLRDFPSSPKLLNDLEKTYEWLNANCDSHQSNARRLLGALHTQPVFLNVTDPLDFNSWEWRSADELLLNENKAYSHYVPVKSFLLPLEKLLRTAGAQAIVHPELPPLMTPSSDLEQLISIRSTFADLRQARLLTDVVFVTGESDEEAEILPCHRAFLATYSSFFYDVFTNEMETANRDASVNNPKTINVEDYSVDCVSCALDYVYTGTISDADSKDLLVMLELLQLSDFWQMHSLQLDVQRLIIERRLINLVTCQQIEHDAEIHHADILVDACREYREKNSVVMRDEQRVVL
ncbi:hypothetical protein H0H87_006848 [Tephrocybe sp. NHM501043]|nr:hypothetical protein H0H87_006848 [Tephrocybe sp. NHM501043]